MNVLKKNKKIIIITLCALFILLISRFTLLGTSARFVWDESDDLIRMAEIVRRNPITLIGPMNANKTAFHSSLTYYMVMPGALLTNFHPLGLVYTTAIYGCITILILAYLASRFFKWRFWQAMLFFTALFPLVQTSRWAWNPHFIPFWQSLGFILFYKIHKKKSPFLWLMTGALLTIPFYNHWYAIFASGGLGLCMLYYLGKEKRYIPLLSYIFGSVLVIAPLLIFDLLHPPGLFITRALVFSPISPTGGGFMFSSIPAKLIQFPVEFLTYFFQNKIIATLFLASFLPYCFLVLKNKQVFITKKLLLIPILTQIIGLTFIAGAVFEYYYLGAVIPFLLFLIIPDKVNFINKYRILLIISLFVLSIYPSIGEINKNTWMTNIDRKMKIYSIIRDNLPKNTKCNVFVPASKSGDAVGKIYRDLLIARDDIWLLTQEEYNDYKCLFVVSTNTIPNIQKDAAYELDKIRKIQPVKKWKVEGTDWSVYYFRIKDQKKDTTSF